MSEITKLCRELRKNMTESEKALWESLRNNKLGYKFRRQHPLVFQTEGVSNFFITDFVCIEKKLIIEVDGKIHEKQMEQDKNREFILTVLGFRVIRFSNEKVCNEISDVIKEIIENLRD